MNQILKYDASKLSRNERIDERKIYRKSIMIQALAEGSAILVNSFGNLFKRICVGVLMDASANWEPFWSAFFSTWIKYIHTDSYHHARTQLSRRITLLSSDTFILLSRPFLVLLCLRRWY